MPPLKVDLDQIRTARTRLAEQREAERASIAEYQRDKAKLDALRRSGADPRVTERAATQLARRADRS